MPRRPSTISKQRVFGQYMTPSDLAQQMAELFRGDWRSVQVLDPACGDGNLLLAAAAKMLEFASPDEVASRLIGVEIDEALASAARQRLAALLGVEPERVRVSRADFLELCAQPEWLAQSELDGRRAVLVLANPPYGGNREYVFFDRCNEVLPNGTFVVFLVPLAFIDRVSGPEVRPLAGRPMGVTTGHAIVHHYSGAKYRTLPVRDSLDAVRGFQVQSGVKLYSVGAGSPSQTEKIVREKPYSSSSPREGWLPCLRCGDIQPYSARPGRLWVDYGPHLAHPKDLLRFTRPRVMVSRIPRWRTSGLRAALVIEPMLCAGDVLLVTHEEDDHELLEGLTVYLNSEHVNAHILALKPSTKHRDSFPKIAGKDLASLLRHHLPNDRALREMAADYASLANEGVSA